MATDQQFCLRWNNHQSTLISVFDSLLENGVLVDCTLAAEGQYLKAHKVVLSACSPYLETLLSQHYEKHPIVILKDVKFTELKSMMDYMYRGEVNISQDQLGTFLKAAESLQIKGLSDNGDDATAAPATKRQEASTRSTVTEVRNVESKRPAVSTDLSDASRDGSISPSSMRKRRRTRRNSQGDDTDSHLDTTSNACDFPSQSTPISVPSTNVPTPVQTLPKQIVKQEPSISRIDNNLNSTIAPESGLLKEKIEPPSEPLLEPKTEYLDYMNNENSIEVEDLTLDDDEDLDSSMDASRAGPSHGDMSNQGYQWPMGDQSGTDEIFMAAQQAVGAATGQQRDSQDWSRKVKVELHESEQTVEDLEDCAGDLTLLLNDPSSNVITTNPVTGKPDYTCPRCLKVYSTRGTLVGHLKFECGQEPKFSCPHCPYKSHRKDNIKSHLIAKHDKEKKIKCPFCVKAFVHKSRLQEHIRLFHDKEALLWYPHYSQLMSNSMDITSELQSSTPEKSTSCPAPLTSTPIRGHDQKRKSKIPSEAPQVSETNATRSSVGSMTEDNTTESSSGAKIMVDHQPEIKQETPLEITDDSIGVMPNVDKDVFRVIF